jgi:hypothetical protein
MGWRQDTRKAAQSGGELTRKEAKQIAKQYEKASASDVRKYASTLSSAASNSNSNNNNNKSFDQQVFETTGGKYPFQWQFEHETGLANLEGGYGVQTASIQANAATAAAGLRAEADKEVARLYSDAQKYSSQLGLEGVKYGADKEAEWRQGVANIEVKGKLDLQPIINAGLERVAGIEAQASRDVAETTGRYSLESMKERTAADKNIGRMQLAGNMYGLINAAFG